MVKMLGQCFVQLRHCSQEFLFGSSSDVFAFLFGGNFVLVVFVLSVSVAVFKAMNNELNGIIRNTLINTVAIALLLVLTLSLMYNMDILP